MNHPEPPEYESLPTQELRALRAAGITIQIWAHDTERDEWGWADHHGNPQYHREWFHYRPRPLFEEGRRQ